MILTIIFGFVDICVGYYLIPLIINSIKILMYTGDSVIAGIEILFGLVEIILCMIGLGILTLITFIFWTFKHNFFYKRLNKNIDI